jgi:hypothetical protein
LRSSPGIVAFGLGNVGARVVGSPLKEIHVLLN